MAHVILSGRYGNRKYGRGMLGALAPTATIPQPLSAPVSAQSVPATSPVPAGPPPDAKMIAQGIYLDMGRGDLWFNGARIAIISAVVSAIAVKLVLFGGNKAGALARSQFARFKGEAKS